VEMKLLALDIHDYCLLKVVCVSAFVGVDVSVMRATAEELGKATSLLLETPKGNEVTQAGMIKYLTSLSTEGENSGVMGNDPAAVTAAIDSYWEEFEANIQVLLSLVSATGDVSAAKKKANAAVQGYLSSLESKFKTTTYCVGERPTVADVVLFAVCTGAMALEEKASSAWTAYPSVYRWYSTMKSHGAIISATSKVEALQIGLKAPTSSVGEKWDRGRVRVKELLKRDTGAIGTAVTMKGWVRTLRSGEKGALLFVELTDGSTVRGIQLVIKNDGSVPGSKAVEECGGAGASVSVKGEVVASIAKGQTIEVMVKEAVVLGVVEEPRTYPMAKKAHSLEHLRDIAHLRPRSKMFSSAMRMRHAMAFATHEFFNTRGFVYVHTPLITGADCEGAGEMFNVTTLLPEDGLASSIPTDKKGKIDYSKDFFSQQCALTVSGQLNVETHACALTDVYTFGPTFRAENSHTSRHLAEFWMIEPEICFAELSDDMALAEDYVRYCARYALENCQDDLDYFENVYPAGEKGLTARLRNVVDNDFARITYTEAVELLQKKIAEKAVKFENYPNWGDDLNSEHERYLCEKVYNKPTIVINYPKGIKAFYMKLNDDQETVAAMDILVPKIGELVGGSQREDDLATLQRRAKESGFDIKDIWWYADLRKYGTVPHAGFGLGFERLVMFVTGLENIRDVIPFPRVPGRAEF
jgi:asparaginyl-tRNA synthetase